MLVQIHLLSLVTASSGICAHLFSFCIYPNLIHTKCKRVDLKQQFFTYQLLSSINFVINCFGLSKYSCWSSCKLQTWFKYNFGFLSYYKIPVPKFHFGMQIFLEDSCLLECDILSLDGHITKFKRVTMPSPSVPRTARP